MRVLIELGPEASKMVEGIPEDEIPFILKDVVEDSLANKVYIKDKEKYVPKKEVVNESSKDKEEIMSTLQEILLLMKNGENVRITTPSTESEDGVDSSSSAVIEVGNTAFEMSDATLEMFKDLFK